MGRANTIICL